MAAPHVSGAIAIYLESYPNVLPAEADAAMKAAAIPDAIRDPGRGSPNLLLCIPFAAATGCIPPPSQIAPGQSMSGTLSPDDCYDSVQSGSYHDAFVFEAREGSSYTVTMTSRAFDTFLVVRDPGRGLVTTDDDGNGGTDSRVQFTARRTGSYLVEATSYAAGATGSYVISVADRGSSAPAAPTALSAPNVRTTSVDLTWKVRITNLTPASTYRFGVRAGNTIACSSIAEIEVRTR